MDSPDNPWYNPRMFHETREQAQAEFKGLTDESYYDFSPNQAQIAKGVWSKSELIKFSKNPVVWNAHLPFFATEKMKFGSLVDCRLTEPDQFNKRYLVTKETDGRTKAFKDAKKAAIIEKKELLKESILEQSIEVENVFRQHPLGARCLEGMPQQVWKSVVEINGPIGQAFIALKGKPDFVIKNDDGTVDIVDLKVSGFRDDKEIKSISKSFGYHWQEYIYSMLAEAQGLEVNRFSFAFLGRDEPHDFREVEFTANAIEWASRNVHRAFSKIYFIAGGASFGGFRDPVLKLGDIPKRADYWDTVPGEAELETTIEFHPA